jgi:membrane protein
MMSKRQRMSVGQVWRFLTEDVWDIEIASLTRYRALGVKAARVLHLVVRGFREDECPLHASALTFSTLMSIVPILALSLALARGLGGEEAAKVNIREAISTWTETFRHAGAAQVGEAEAVKREVEAAPDGREKDGRASVGEPSPDAETSLDIPAQIDRLVEQAFEKVQNINFAALSGVGLLILLFSVVNVLGRVEDAFNRVWGVTVGRSMWRRFADYLSILLVLPILGLAATSLPVMDYASQFLDTQAAGALEKFLNVLPLKRLMVLAMTTLSFGFLITFMPNTRVRGWAGLAGGAVTALLFIGWLSLCAMLQVGVASQGRIYGSFAIVPILLAWVHVSWQIVLFGAEVAFAVQNCTTYRMEQSASRASMTARIVLALLVLREAARCMRDPATAGLNVTAMARKQGVPVRFVNDVVAELSKAGFLGRLTDESGLVAMLRPPTELTVREVTEVMLRAGMPPESLGLGRVDAALTHAVERMRRGLETSLERMAVQDLLKA